MKHFIFILLSTLSLSFSKAQCLEITSIFVDACTPGGGSTPCSQEGVNEMFTFKVGASNIYVDDIIAVWPGANNFLNWCRNTGTANSTDSLNQTIISSCGFLKEPLNDTLPAGANVLVITSTDFCLAANSFEGLADTMYIIYQCAGNTAGHFANTGSGTRDLIVSVSNSCFSNHFVSYDRSLLIGGDGATVLYDGAGNATYVNNGCAAPVITVNADWAFTNVGSFDGNICNDYGILNLNTLLSVSATLGGTWIGARVTGNNYNPNGYVGIDSITYSVDGIGQCLQNTDSTIVFNVVAPPVVNIDVEECDSILLNGTWYTSNQTVTINSSSPSFYGCDSTTNINLTITSIYRDSTLLEACDSIIYNGITYFNDTILRDTVSGVASMNNVCPELFISEYVEGQSNNKAIEIFNGTGATVDLSIYTLIRYTNGSPTPSATINLSGMLADGDVYVIYHTSAAIGISSVGDLASGAITHNGNDAYSLNKNGVIIDVFGNIGCTPGTEWTDLGNGTADNVLYRLPNYTTGLTTTINPPCDFPSLNASNWVSLDVDDDFSFLGSHTANCLIPSSSACDSIKITNLKVNFSDTIQNPNNPITICSTNDSVQLSDGTFAHTAGIYFPISGTNASGCNSYLETVIETEICTCSVNLGPDTVICKDETITLDASTNNATYTWQDGSTLSTFTVSEQGTYWVDVTANNCTARDSIVVSVDNPQLLVSLDTTICIGDSIILSASGTASVLWSTNETNNNITVSPNTSTIYTVQGTSAYSCQSNQEQIEIIVQQNIDNVSFNISPSDTINEGESIQIIVNGDNIDSYSWTPIIENTNTLIDNPSQTSTYVVRLNNPPCPSVVDSITIVVNILEDVALVVPNGFTPNGDGLNDVFRVVNYEDFESYILKIYNRWGQLIFKENGYAASWDGNYKGKDQNLDAYIYYIDAKPANGRNNIIATGTIAIIR